MPDPADRPGVIVERPRPNWSPTGQGARVARWWPLVLFPLIVPVLLMLGPGLGSGSGAGLVRAAVAAAGVVAVLIVVSRALLRLVRAGMHSRWLVLGLMATVMVSFAAAIAIMGDRPFLLTLFRLIPALAPATGVGLMGLAFGHRIGQTLHCTRCDYEYTRGGPYAPERCPECGAHWLERGGLQRGRKRTGRWGFVAAGAIVLVAPMVVQLRPSTWKLAPSSLLIARVGDPHAGFTDNDMKILAGRSLNSAQIRRLATALLDKRRITTYLNPSEDAWIEAQISAGAMPLDLVDRYNREMVELWVVAPERARVGVPITVGIGVADHSTLSGLRHAYLVVGGYWLDGQAERDGRGDKAELAMQVGAEHRSFGRVERGLYPHEVTLAPASPGPTTIHLEVWLLIPRGAVSARPPAAIWNADGTLKAPPGILFMDRFEITKSLKVDP